MVLSLSNYIVSVTQWAVTAPYIYRSKVQLSSEHGNRGGNLLVVTIGWAVISHPPINLRQDVHKVILVCQLLHGVHKGLDET